MTNQIHQQQFLVNTIMYDIYNIYYKAKKPININKQIEKMLNLTGFSLAQQDASEFLSIWTDKLNAEMEVFSNKNLLPFTGKIRIEKCRNNHYTESFQSTNVINVELVNDDCTSILNSLVNLTKPHINNFIDEYGNNILIKEKKVFVELPNVLIISLGIFNMDECGNIYKKSKNMHIEKILDVSILTIENQNKYRLYGVVKHFGHSPISGHYTAARYVPKLKKWVNFDDHCVTTTSFEEATNFNGQGTPYILFYQKL